ncbi:pilus assembly protein TadG-related protein [Pseudomonas sp. SCB32]|uniref:pilus assembly protein TadG-related protein n=1 Tax=Pseudomonas sp. SCB32 TaxID=2653853 RepID=UPI0012640D35|nr:pilus assembly protein TadG-related protein [Pseudomonas sp. SCB32]
MGRERQQGAVGVMAAGTLLLALICLALVVDTGRLYLEQRKLQRVVDDAALETASQSGMCGSQSAGQIQAYAASSATSNGFTPGSGDSLVATLGTVQFDSGYAGARSRRVFSAGGDLADSVQVQATHTVPSSLILNVASLFTGASANTTLSAHAVARRTAMAELSAGSGVLSLDTSNSALLNGLLGGLLGTTLNLDVVTYQGIAGANVSLLALSQQLKAAGVNLDVGKVDSLLGANVSAAQLLQAMVSAADASQVANVNTALLRTALASINVPTAQLTLGQILSVVAPDSVRDTALSAGVNLFDLLMATALVANKNHAVTVPAQALSIPGLATQKLSLTVISPPQIAIGYPGKNSDGSWRTQATSTQVSLDAHVTVDLLNLKLVTADVDLKVDIAKGTAALESIKCGGVGKPVEVDIEAKPGIANLTLKAGVGLLPGASGYLVKVDVSNGSQATSIAAGGEQLLVFNVASPADLPSPVQRVTSPLGASLAAGLADLSKNLAVTVKLAPNNCDLPLIGWLLCPIGALVNSVSSTLINSEQGVGKLLTGALSNLVGVLGSMLIDPLLKLLGVQTGILDVRLIDLQTSGATMLI